MFKLMSLIAVWVRLLGIISDTDCLYCPGKGVVKAVAIVLNAMIVIVLHKYYIWQKRTEYSICDAVSGH